MRLFFVTDCVVIKDSFYSDFGGIEAGKLENVDIFELKKGRKKRKFSGLFIQKTCASIFKFS